jgi:uncharacterized membrane protein YecN with MAPEG domain
MLVPITGIYIALLALVGLGLQQHVGVRRLAADVSLGDGGDEGLTVAMRRQANFVEQVPVALLLFVALELNGASALWLHSLGVALLVARIVHPFGLEFANSKRIPRFIGAAGTLVIMLVAIGKLLWQVL